MESAGFNVISWNVNGLRTINIKDTLAQLNCSILGIQETKLASKSVTTNCDQSKIPFLVAAIPNFIYRNFVFGRFL